MVVLVCALLLLAPLACQTQSVPVDGRYEVCVPLESVYSNPFDYSKVAVQGKFSGPDGQVTVDGFYYQAYTRSNDGGSEKLTPDGDPQWCVRFSPRTSGSFQTTITVTNSSGTFTIKTDSFQASQGDTAGFIGRSLNGVHFQFTNGSTYYPIGENVCWVRENKGTYDYDNYFGKLAASGGNYARLWLTDSGWDDLAVEVGLTNMSLTNTWQLDYVVELAESLNMHLLMCTESFNYFCTKITNPCDWKSCYYNTANGGFLSKPADFFTDEKARADYKNRLRYIVARYGYSTSVFAWEFFNEVDLTDDYDGSVQLSWNEEMSSYLHSVDVNDHLISTSFSNSDGDQKVQASSALDFTMTHNYGSSDIAQDTAQYPYKKLMLYKKPSYVAEFGIGDENEDKAGVSLHNGVWAPLFSMGAGTCMTWWWDSWVEPNNLYPIYKPFAEFVSRLALANYTWSHSQPTTNGTDVRVWGIVGEGAGRLQGKEMVVAWVQDDCYTWKNQHDGKQCHQQRRVQIVTPGCKHESGGWRGYWYNTHTGQTVSNKTVACLRGSITDEVPPFSEDIAVYYTF